MGFWQNFMAKFVIARYIRYTQPLCALSKRHPVCSFWCKNHVQSQMGATVEEYKKYGNIVEFDTKMDEFNSILFALCTDDYDFKFKMIPFKKNRKSYIQENI